MSDLGNPNFFTVFKGKHEIDAVPPATTDKGEAMLSCTNIVELIGNWTLTGYDAGSAFAVLAPQCRPGKQLKMPVTIENVVNGVSSLTVEPDGSMVLAEPKVATLTVEPDGSMRLDTSCESATVFLAGTCFNISNKWY